MPIQILIDTPVDVWAILAFLVCAAWPSCAREIAVGRLFVLPAARCRWC